MRPKAVFDLAAALAAGVAVAVAANGGSACAQAAGAGGIDRIDLGEFPADVIDEVIVPVPSEVFSVMDKLGRPNWRAEMRTRDIAGMTDRYAVALQFGVVVADGFIAVQAEDRQVVQNLGQEVRRLAEQLGLKDPVLKHAQSIMDCAEDGNFDAVREELDRTQTTVREEMEKLRDGELAQCVSIGGWLRGTEVVTSLIARSYSREQAELLYQPDLVDHFRKSITGMGAPVRESSTMREVATGLEVIGGAMVPTDDGLIPPDAIDEIHRVCQRLVEVMVTGKVAGEPGGAAGSS